VFFFFLFTMPTVLYYFGAASNHQAEGFRGLSEPIRAFAAATDFPLEFNGVDITTWQEQKDTAPLGQLPYAVLDCGFRLPQSSAILAYIAEQTGHAGETPIEKAKIRMIDGALVDAAQGWNFGDLTDAEKLASTKAKIENIFAKLSPLLGKDFAAGGSTFTVADARLWGEVERLNFLFADLVIPENIKTFAANFAAIPAVKNHVDTVAPKSFVPAFFIEKNEYLQGRVAATKN